MFKRTIGAAAMLLALLLAGCSGTGGSTQPETAGSAEAEAQSFVPKPAEPFTPSCRAAEGPSEDEKALMASGFCLFGSMANDDPQRGRVSVGLWASPTGVQGVVVNGTLNSVTLVQAHCIIPWDRALPPGLTSEQKVRRAVDRVKATWSPSDFTMHDGETKPSWRDDLLVCRHDGVPSGPHAA